MLDHMRVERRKPGSHLLLSSSVETLGMEHIAEGRGGQCHQAWTALLVLLLLLVTEFPKTDVAVLYGIVLLTAKPVGSRTGVRRSSLLISILVMVLERYLWKEEREGTRGAKEK